MIAARARLPDLLAALGSGVITSDLFWRHMSAAGLGDADIDAYCADVAGWLPDDGGEADDGLAADGDGEFEDDGRTSA